MVGDCCGTHRTDAYPGNVHKDQISYFYKQIDNHDAAFHLKAKAERGTVKVTGTEEKIHVSGETVSKAIGMSPKHTIKASVGSGTINFSLK